MTQTPPISAEQVEDLCRAAKSLLGTLWQQAYSGSRTFDENWVEMERRFPQSKWLQEALTAAASIPASRGAETDTIIEELRRELVDARTTADDFCKENVRLTDALIAANLASVPDYASPAPQPVQEQIEPLQKMQELAARAVLEPKP